MYNRQSIYRNPHESVSSNALAAASALGKAMSPNGRQVDHSKIPFYNAPSKIASLTNLSRSPSMTKKSSSPGRRSSMYVSSSSSLKDQEQKENSNTGRRKIIIRSPSLPQKHNSVSRRASSLPSDRHHSITSKLSERDAQHTFQEFGGPQSNSNLLNSQPIRTMKKYIPGPHGLIAVEVPIDDDMKRRKRGSYSLTSNHPYLRRSSSVNQHLRSRVSSDTLNRGSSQRTNSFHNNTKEPLQTHKPTTTTKTSTTTTTTTFTKRRISSSSNNDTNKTNIPKSKSHQNVTSNNKIQQQPKQKIQLPKHSHYEESTSIETPKRTLHKPPREPVPMIESSMPEETELELENESLSAVVENQETPSKIELNELLEENIELAEQLHNNVSIASNIGRKEPEVKEPEHNQTFDSIVIAPQSNNEVLKLTADDTIDNTANDDRVSELNIYPIEQKGDNEEVLLEKETLGTHVNKILQVEDENIARANRSVTSSFYDDDEGIGNDSFNTDVSQVSELEYKPDNDHTEEQIQPIVLNDKSFASSNHGNTTVEDALPRANDTSEYGEPDVKDLTQLQNEGVEDILQHHPEKLTPEMEKKEMDALGLQLVDNPYLEDEEPPSDEIRDGSSDYMTTEEDHAKTLEEPTHPIPPPMSPKRHREGVHPVNNNTHRSEQTVVATPKITVNSTEVAPVEQSQHITSQKNTDSSVTHPNSRTTMADYLRSANPYLNKKDIPKQKEHPKKTTKTSAKTHTAQSTSVRKQASSPTVMSNKVKSPTKTTQSSHQELKPPPKLSQGGTPIKSALKKTRSNGSGNSPYEHTPANSAYLSLTTAENTRLNAQMSMENLGGRKGSVKKSKRPQSMVAQPTQRISSPVTKEIKKKPTAPVERQQSTLRNSRIINKTTPTRRHSKIERSKPIQNQNRESMIENTAKQMAQDPRMNSILYPVEPIAKKSSFEKLRPEADHLGFKSMSLRGGVTNEVEYEQNSMSNKFHQSEATPSYPISQQQRSQQLQPLTASMGPGGGSGWTSRFQDSDSDDDFIPPSNNNSGGRGRSGSMNGSSPSKSKNSGFSLFRSKKNHDSQDIPQQQLYQQQYAPVSSPLGTKFSKASLRTASAAEQSPSHAKSGLRSQQRVHSEPQAASGYRTGSNGTGDNDDHKKSNKFGNKLKKIFGRKK